MTFFEKRDGKMLEKTETYYRNCLVKGCGESRRLNQERTRIMISPERLVMKKPGEKRIVYPRRKKAVIGKF